MIDSLTAYINPESSSYSFSDDFIQLKKLGFIAHDLNGDQQICEVDVIAFDNTYCIKGKKQSKTILGLEKDINQITNSLIKKAENDR